VLQVVRGSCACSARGTPLPWAVMRIFVGIRRIRTLALVAAAGARWSIGSASLPLRTILMAVVDWPSHPMVATWFIRLRHRKPVPTTLLAPMDRNESALIPGTDELWGRFFAGRRVDRFHRWRQLKKAPLHGGAPISVCAKINPSIGSWGQTARFSLPKH